MLKSFSQLEQDFEIVKFYKGKANGYFVDVGANDGLTFSNSFLLERFLNWKGICVEPLPSMIEILNENRKCIVSPYAAYSESGKTLEFSIHNGDSMFSGITSKLSGHNENMVKSNSTTITVQTKTLTDILKDANAPKFIEYLSLDTEGSEYDILKVFDWDTYTFGCIDVEHNYQEPARSNIRTLLESKGYKHMREVQWDDAYIHTSLL
jgi:FkbM family methyltransferase